MSSNQDNPFACTPPSQSPKHRRLTTDPVYGGIDVTAGSLSKFSISAPKKCGTEAVKPHHLLDMPAEKNWAEGFSTGNRFAVLASKDCESPKSKTSIEDKRKNAETSTLAKAKAPRKEMKNAAGASEKSIPGGTKRSGVAVSDVSKLPVKVKEPFWTKKNPRTSMSLEDRENNEKEVDKLFAQPPPFGPWDTSTNSSPEFNRLSREKDPNAWKNVSKSTKKSEDDDIPDMALSEDEDPAKGFEKVENSKDSPTVENGGKKNGWMFWRR
ncbi:hypothetical protein BCR34DRAFT_598388 [Clohesyomyces aquaticus]|uniref:Uncharacterized protein n=1 Tax=Clohesyomyces aquaticus TaxID=1231657 RepID=A0A1Y1ZYQ2_9PLEO|nr:hypothetical protein BCR34DRAFT_598388 [Clohesyomyces aquaticus]